MAVDTYPVIRAAIREYASTSLMFAKTETDLNVERLRVEFQNELHRQKAIDEEIQKRGLI
jgi:hypothetical protein